jgi:hypothetical protein
MLFLDQEKFILSQEELSELTAVFPEFMLKNRPLRIAYNEHKIKKLQTNNPRYPFVFTKPKYGAILIHNFIDDETGEQREVRYSDGSPQYRADGRKVFLSKTKVIDSSFVFDPRKDKELLWFFYNFSTLFSNSKNGRKTAPFKFLMPEREATQKAVDVLTDAKAKAAVGSLSSEKLRQFAVLARISVLDDDSNELILNRIFNRMDKDVEFKKYVINTFLTSPSEDILSLLENAWNMDLLKPSMDGNQTVIIVNGKESVLADIPVDNRTALVEYLSKDKKALSQLKKAIA